MILKSLVARMRNGVTRANAVSEGKKSFRKFDFFSFALIKCKTKKGSDDETKNIAGKILETTRSHFPQKNRLFKHLISPCRKHQSVENKS